MEANNQPISLEKNPEEEAQETALAIQNQLKGSPDVIMLANQVVTQPTNDLLQFGNEPAQEISKFADGILHNIRSNSIEDSNVMLKKLTTIMTKFDKKDFNEKEKNFISKMFSNAKKDIDKLLKKYKTLGDEIDGVYVQIKKYEHDLSDSNKTLEEMYEKNLTYYKELGKFIEAGKIAVDKLKNEKVPELQQRASQNDQEAIMQLDSLQNTIDLFEQRVHDLVMAQTVSFQTAPQIRMIQKTNNRLLAKMNSAFIVTIPVFKNAMITQISLKKQKVAIEGMNALDEATNKLLLQNAQNIKDQTVEVARMSGKTSVSIETLESAFNTIMDGIDETKKIEAENRTTRQASIQKMEQLQKDFMQKMQNK